MRWAGNVARLGRRGMHVGYWRESQNEREIGWDGMDWIDLVQDRDR
jgi:hypothetical protein